MNFYSITSNHVGKDFVFNLKGSFEERRAINQFLKSPAFTETDKPDITYFVSDDVTEAHLKKAKGAPGDSGAVIIASAVKEAIEDTVKDFFEFIPVTIETKSQSLQRQFFALKFANFGDIYDRALTQTNKARHNDYSVTLNGDSLSFHYGIRDNNYNYFYLLGDDFKTLTKPTGLKLSKRVYHLS